MVDVQILALLELGMFFTLCMSIVLIIIYRVLEKKYSNPQLDKDDFENNNK